MCDVVYFDFKLYDNSDDDDVIKIFSITSDYRLDRLEQLDS